MHTAEEAPKCIQSERKKMCDAKDEKKKHEKECNTFFSARGCIGRSALVLVTGDTDGGENAGERKYKTHRRRSLRTFLSTFLAKHVLSMKFGDFLVLYFFFLLPNTTTIKKNPFILAKGVRRSQTIYC